MDFFTPEQLAILAAGTVRCDLVVKFDFLSGPKFAWNGNTILPIGAELYQPMYGTGSIEGLGYSAGATSEVVTLTLSGIPGGRLDILAAALAETEEVDQRLLVVSLQLFDDDWQIVGSPIPLFHGFMQPPEVTRAPMQGTEGGSQTITLSAENIFFGRARPPNGRNTDRDQQARSPGDTFFGFVAELLQKTFKYPDYSD